MTLAGIEPETFLIVAQHLKHCATAVRRPVMFVKLFHWQNSVTRDSSVGIATRYRLDCPGIEPLWGGRDTPHPSIPTLGPTQPPVQSVPDLPRGVRRPGRSFDHPHLAPTLKKDYSSTPPLWTFVTCYRVKFNFTFTFTETIRAWDVRPHVLCLASPVVGEGHRDRLEKSFVWTQVCLMQVRASGTFLNYIANERKVYSELCLLCLVREQKYSCQKESVSVGNDTVSHL